MNKHLRTFTELLMLSGAAVGFAISVNQNNETGALVTGAAFAFLAAMLLIRFVKPRQIPRQTRIVLVATGLWVALLQAWGFIWGWGHYFDGLQFLALHVAVPAIAWAAWSGVRWATR